MSKTGTDALRFDVRTLERNIRQGTLTHKEVREYLDSLPDVAGKSMTLGEAAGDDDAAFGRDDDAFGSSR
jgi:hypothetical protein